ncbi:MAG TPA: sugar phosphate isomerase/epimerase [bacterium]|nr:sugar phosphate isomerase/epimerase [bacterium]HXK95098.1 sugar phosphate isomerase/epimerase [bacterium]
MFHTLPLNRRGFISAAGLAALTLTGLQGSAGAVESSSASASASASASDPSAKNLKLGLASYTTRKFSLDETLEMMNQIGVKYITLKDFHLKMDSTKEERQEAARKIKAAGVTLMGCGVVYLKNDEKQIRNAFEYARDAGMPVMVSAPDLDALPAVAKMAEEFDIKVAIHNHGPNDERYPSHMDAYRSAKQFGEHMGVCIDVGHTVRLGLNEVEAVHAVHDRLYDFHIKDVTSRDAKGGATEVGRGVIDIPGVLQALLEVGFTGHVALEYEKNADHPLPGMIESFAYIRGALAALYK